MDKLIVKGFGNADGTYEFDLIDLVNIGTPSALTTREQHRVTVETNVLPADLLDAVKGLNAAVMVSLTGIVLNRAGKKANEDRLWDARYIYSFGTPADLDGEKVAVAYVIADRDASEDDADPPAIAATAPQSTSGGGSTKQTSENQEDVPSRTGLHALATSAGSDREILAS